MKRRTLRQARKDKGWTQEQLARLSKVEQASISKLERGDIADPRQSTVKALEHALGVPHGTLIFGTEALAS